MSKLSRLVNAITDAVTTTTSASIQVKYAEKIILMINRADHTSGSSVITVQGSIDGGDTFVDLAILRDNAVGVLTLVDKKTLNANGTSLVSIELNGSGFAFDQIKVKATRVTDGTNNVKVYIVE